MPSIPSLLTVNRERCAENAAVYHPIFARYIESGITPNLAIAVWKNGEVIYQGAQGRKMLAEGAAAITDSTRFNIGSVTKPVTGSLFIKLAELGEITLNDSVKRYIGEFVSEEVTIAHLLTHTAGYLDFPWMPWPRKDTLESYLQQIYATVPSCAPGQTASYYTYGYSILMDLLQRVAGCSIEEFARAQLFDPLGMNDTTYNMAALAADSYVLPCNMENDGYDPACEALVPSGDSGLYSTAGDLLAFAAMILSKGRLNGRRVFSEPAIDLMTRECTGGATAGRTPIFWTKSSRDIHGCFADLNSPAAIGHPGFSGCMLMMDPVYGVAAAVLTSSQKLHADWRHYRSIWNTVMTMEA